MDNLLFKDFEPVSEKEWKQKIQVDLKGKDYNSSMITTTDEGIDIKPFYHRESNVDLNIPSPKKWFVTEKIESTEIHDTESLQSKGTEAFWLSTDNLEDISQLIKVADAPVIIKSNLYHEAFGEQHANLHYAFDPINHLATTGNWVKSQSEDMQAHKSYVEQKNTISIDARLYHNSGGNITQQLAYTISQLNAYLNKSDLTKEKTLKILVLSAIGPNYFFEIAKLKALRLLVNSVCKANNINYDLKIISEPGQHHMSIYDYNVNMLRSTSECMSAILGGSNFIRNTYYDEIFKTKNQFSQRISRNQLLILKHESYFNIVENIADGTYYINYLTKALAEKSLSINKDIEKSGGFVQQLFDGKIQLKLEQQFKSSLEKFESKELKLVGVNQYQNEQDKMKTEIEKEWFSSKRTRKTLIKPILKRRIAEELEQKRLSEESE
jgi:methylmalonyl-CoA mutase